ncbi:MAG: SDR family oxidoreductase [Pedobacter sp.]|uniref:SDR family oxidoreductase n=1 Tax=Pedobacter sp. TaxID=1411316 RepID=UPI003395A312
MKKTIFITGASAGVGKATAKLFNAMGWKVIATMRNPEKEAELSASSDLRLLKLDVTDPASVDQAVAAALSGTEVDVVLNNAGYYTTGALETLNDEQIRQQFDTNLFGVIRLTKAFTPYFRERKQGMFINVSSMVGLFGYPERSVYVASKFALDGFSESMAYELAGFGIGLKIIVPGGITTGFGDNAVNGAQHVAYRPLEEKMGEGRIVEGIRKFSSAEDVALVIYQAATDRKDQLRYITGADADAVCGERERIGAEAHYQKIKAMFTFDEPESFLQNEKG